MLTHKALNQTGKRDQKSIERSMRELQAERDALDFIMENTNTQLAYLDIQFNFLHVNSAYVQGSGRSRNDLIGKNYFDLFPNTENQKIFESVRDSGQPIEYHAKPFVYKDQPERDITYWDWSLSPVKDKEGNVQGLVLSLNEVTNIQRQYTDAKYSVVKLLGLIAGSIFVAEAIIMGIFQLLPEFSLLTVALFDAVILTLIVFPLLYFLLVKPLTINIAKRNYAERALQKAYNKMKVAVNERTTELVTMNEQLRQEILDREKIEKKIEMERIRLFSVLDRLPASVHLLKPDHTISFTNRYFRQQFGDQAKQPCHKILHGLDAPCSVCNAFEVISTGKPDEHEEKHIDGNLYRVYNYPFTDTDGSSLILQLGIDITAHKKAEEDLRKSEERFRILINSIDDTVFTLDRKKRFLEIYGNLFDRLGISTQKSLKKSMEKVFDVEKNKNHDQAISKALNGESVIYEWTKSTEDEIRYIQNSISPIFDESGNADGVVGVARDITEQKRIERLQIETERLMTVAGMSAMISHEFRNSLTSVRMILELQYESENLNSTEKKSLSVALSSLTHMEDIVTQLLNFSRPKPMEFKLGDLNSLILECIEFTRPQFKKKDIDVHYERDDSLPLINLDRSRLKEATINLILNAIQAIDVDEKDDQRRRIEIRTEKHFLIKTLRDVAIREFADDSPIDKQGMIRNEVILVHGDSCALMTIKDSGIGIKTGDMKRIFNPFYTTAVQGGTGLGLSTVKRTINAHRGIIRVESEWGKGTIFRIYLPLTID